MTFVDIHDLDINIELKYYPPSREQLLFFRNLSVLKLIQIEKCQRPRHSFSVDSSNNKEDLLTKLTQIPPNKDTTIWWDDS